MRLAMALFLLNPVMQANAACKRIDREHMTRLNWVVFYDLAFDRHDAGEVIRQDYAFLDGGTLYFHAKCDVCHASYKALSDIEEIYKRYPAAFMGWQPTWS